MATVIQGRRKTSDIINEGIAEGITSGIQKGYDTYTQNVDNRALQKAIQGLPPEASARDILNTIIGTKTHSAEAKENALKNYLGAEKIDQIKKKQKTEVDQSALKAKYLAAGYPEHEADLMSDPDVTPATKQKVSAYHTDQIARGYREPPQQNVPNQQPQNQQQPQSVNVQEQMNQPGIEEDQEIPLGEEQQLAPELNEIEQKVKQEKNSTDEWPVIPPPAHLTDAEREKHNSQNQRFNNTELKNTRKASKAHKDTIVRLGITENLNNTHKVANGMSRVLIDPNTGDIRPTAALLGLVNEETQRFVKTINDFLIGAKDYFGSRVTNFDISAFKSRLPNLLNTEDGRRMIIEQMKLMEELQYIYDNELEQGLKHYGRDADYSKITDVVDKRVEEKEKTILSKINDLDTGMKYKNQMLEKPEKYKNMTLWQDPETKKFKAFSPEDSNVARERGWIKW